jgi:hypothetical protein
MRRIDKILYSAREQSKNLDYEINATTGATLSGISDDVFLEWCDHAQDHLQAAIIASYPNEFIESIIIPLVGGTDEYSILDRVFVNNKIVSVEYSHSGNASDYMPLDQGSFRDRNSDSGYPRFYIRRGKKIIVNPTPNSSSGTLRVHYYRELDDLDIRRGVVNGVPSGTSLIVNGATDATPSAVEEVRFAAAEYVCICNAIGEPLLYNALVSSYNAGTNTLTFAADVSTYLVTGGTLAGLDNQYVTLKAYSTTHSKLPDNCERYVQTYAQKRALSNDKQNGDITEDAELLLMERDILQSFAEDSRDIQGFQIIDEELMW